MSLAGDDRAVEDGLRRRITKLERINAALMSHVERVTDKSEGAYSLFQTAIMLDGRVRARTEELTGLMHRLERSNLALEAAKNEAERARNEAERARNEAERAKNEAERANRSKTRFLAAASHDLLQPLNAARLSTSTLADLALDAGAAAVVGQVERGLQTIEDLIKTLLDISKLDAGVVQPHRGPVLLRELLGEVEAGFRPAAEGKGLRLALRCPGDLAVDSDPRLLKRIVGNLVSNAVRYTARGGVLVAARRRRGACGGAGAACRIDVVDTGRGIAEAERALVFEEFFRGRSAGEAENGLGLGLAIVRRMAATLGHELGFASRPGRGSWFALGLPLARPAAPTPLPSPAPDGPGAAVTLAGLRVLLVENDPPTLAATLRLLRSWGVAVDAVADPAAILRRPAALAAVDLVLADYHLGRDRVGTAVVAAVRAAAGRPVPAIVATADHTAAVADRVAAAGCVLMHKPLKPAHLRSLMSSLVGNTCARPLLRRGFARSRRKDTCCF